tara:strand:- start:171 stop:281 length:111 start_codon:yes stop_codon:yes gene_type:complete
MPVKTTSIEGPGSGSEWIEGFGSSIIEGWGIGVNGG